MSQNSTPSNPTNEEKAKIKSISALFCVLGGAKLEILRDVPADRGKFISIGIGVLNTALLAVIAMGFTIHSVLITGETEVSNFHYAIIAVCSIFWGWLILGIDWGLVKSLERERTIKWLSASFWIPIISRLGIALLISLVVSTPLEIQLFKNRLDGTKESMRNQMTEKIHKEELQHYEDKISEIEKRLKKAKDEEDEAEDNEDKLSPEAVAKKGEYDTLKVEIQPKIDDLKTKVSNTINSIDKINNSGSSYEKYLVDVKRVDEYGWEYIEQVQKTRMKSSAYNKRENLKSQKRNDENTLAEYEAELKDVKTAWTTIRDEELGKQKDTTGKRKEEVEKLRAEITQLESNRDNANDSLYTVAQGIAKKAISTDLISDLEALEVYKQQPEGEKAALYQNLIRGIIIFVDLIPLILKILFPYSPYDRRLQTHKRQELHLAEQELSLNMHLIDEMARQQRGNITDKSEDIKNILDNDLNNVLRDG